MGLAASQARFLAVTSRKANCEYRSLELAQQKLSLTRELDEASEQYQDAMNATRLVWDVDGTGDFRYDLSYGLMMNPSDCNKYTPYLLSRQDGKIALDKKMMNSTSGIFNIDPETGTTDGGILYNSNVVYRGDKDYEQAQKEAFDKFIDSMRQNKAISSSIADKMEIKPSGSSALKYIYDPAAGVGGELLGREKSNMMTANSLLSYVDFIVDNAMSGYFPYDSEEWKLAEKLIFDFEKHDYVVSAQEKAEKGYKEGVGDERYNMAGALNTKWKSDAGNTCLLINGSYANDTKFDDENPDKNKGGGFGIAQYSASAFTLADLLNEDVTLLVNDKQSYNDILEMLTNVVTGASNANNTSIITKDVDQWYNELKKDDNAYKKLIEEAKTGKPPKAKSSLAILNYVDTLAKGMHALLMPENPTKEENNAFYTALINVISRLRNTNDTTANYYNGDYITLMGTNFRSESFAKKAVNEADNYNCWVKYGGEWAISLSNLTESFLTDFVNGMDNYQNGCLITRSSKASTYITDNPSYLYNVNTTDESKSGLWESEFYSVLFNNICNNGAYLNEQVNDKVYLDNALKNAQLFVVSKGEDNYYYQSRYTQVSGGHLTTETDEAAIAVAEREYSYLKSQINYKEEKIEIETKQLDAEINSLSTELETVKNLIRTNVDKTFKMFSS